MNTNVNNYESLANASSFEGEKIDFISQAGYFPGPGDENDDAEENDNTNDEDNSGNTTDDENPPLDEDVVHSPLTTQPGGKPKPKA